MTLQLIKSSVFFVIYLTPTPSYNSHHLLFRFGDIAPLVMSGVCSINDDEVRPTQSNRQTPLLYNNNKYNAAICISVRNKLHPKFTYSGLLLFA